MIIERFGLIYVLHCLVNDKEYVGQTIKLLVQRLAGHIGDARKGDRRPLYRAIRKYGLENFTVEVIWRGVESELNAAEKRFIRCRKTFIDDGWGYNLTTGGAQYRLSAYSRRKLARSARAQWADPVMRANHAVTNYTRQLMSDACKDRAVFGEYHSVTARARMSRKVKLAWKRPEVRDRYIASLKAKWSRDAEHKKACKAAKKRCTVEWRAAVSERWKRKWADPAYKAMMKVKLRAKWADPVVHEKRLKIAASDAVKMKISRSVKRAWKMRRKKLVATSHQ